MYNIHSTLYIVYVILFNNFENLSIFNITNCTLIFGISNGTLFFVPYDVNLCDDTRPMPHKFSLNVV